MNLEVLFLDDNAARTAAFRSSVPFATLTSTAKECIEELKKTPEQGWDVVFLDHDLENEIYVDGERDDCGMEVVRWIVKNKPQIKKIIVHTHNTKAGLLMEDALKNAGYNVVYQKFSNLAMCDFKVL